MNYFTLFNLPYNYNINLNRLNDKYQELQNKYHPDRFITDSNDKKKYALQQSTIINTAYQILKDPLHRAEYLLTINNIDINHINEYSIDQDFYKKQMILWEELKSIEQDSSHHEKLIIFSSKINQQVNILYNKINTYFKSKKLNAILTIIIKIRFFNKLIQYIDNLENKNRF